MSQDRKKIIKIFCKKFLEVEKTPKSFSDILDLKPIVLKDCEESDNEILVKNKYKQIRNLAKIKPEKIDEIAKKINIKEDKLRKWVLAARLISRAWQKRNSYLKKEEMKINVLGLDNAGKTSMLENLSGKTQIGKVIDLEPTVGVDIRKIQSDSFNLLIWDFGGQVDHRNDYFDSPEDYFLQVDLILFVIDIQDTERYDEAMEYFERISDLLEFLNEKPYYLILLHKSDPDYLANPDFAMNLDLIRELFSNHLDEKKANYEIIQSSIYNYYAAEPEFAKMFKNFFGPKTKTKTTEESLEALSEMVLKLTTITIEGFRNLNSKTFATTEKMPEKQDNLKTPPAPPVSTLNKPPAPPPISSGKPSRKASHLDLMSELKKVFQKRKMME
jgi:GTPase SAR1 family protein